MGHLMWDNIFRHNKKKSTVASALKSNILFSDLNPLELQLVQNIVNVRTYLSGEHIFHQGEAGVGMYIIVSGSVDIMVDEPATASQEAKSSLITRLNSGDFFGEIALVEETGRRTATAIAREETLLIGFFKPDLIEVVNRNPNAGVKILMNLGKVLGTRLAETTAAIKALKLKGEHRAN